MKDKSEARNQKSSLPRGPQVGEGKSEIQNSKPEGPPNGTCRSVGRAITEPGPRPSSLSALQTLSRELQEELFRYSETNSYRKTVRWLATKAGVQASQTAIFRFRRWFHRVRLHEDNMAIARDIIEMRRRTEPDITEEELAHFGRKVFARLAIESQDAPEWARQQMVRQREIRLELEQARIRLARNKFEFDAAAACLRHFAVIKLTVNTSGLTEPQKIERIHQAMWGKPMEITQHQKPNTLEIPNSNNQAPEKPQ
jgi:hypothetical protein